MHPGFAAAYYNRGYIYRENRDHCAAIADFDRALDANANLEEAYYARGLSRIDAENPEAALADFEKMISMKPTLAKGYLGRGIARSKLGIWIGGWRI